MGRRGRGFSTRKRQQKRRRSPSGQKPVQRGQLLQKVCALCDHAMNARGLCSNRKCVRSYPKPNPNPVAADMRQSEESGLWLPPWHEKR